MTRLLLVRHGESEWNAIGRWQGWADPPLTELGMEQARLAAKAVGAVDLIVASDLERAWRTAEVIAAELGVGPVLRTPALRERDAGPWTGLTRVQINEQCPGWIEDGRRPEGYETDDAVLARALPLLSGLDGPDEALVVSHGGLIGAVERHLGLPHERTPNLGGRVVMVDDGQLRAAERILLVDAHDVAVTAPPEV